MSCTILGLTGWIQGLWFGKRLYLDVAGTKLLPLCIIFASFSRLLKILGSLWMPGACTFRALLGALSEHRFGPRKAAWESFNILLLFILSFLLVAFLVLLCKDSFFIGLSQLLLNIGGDGQVTCNVFEEGWTAHDLPFITGLVGVQTLR